MNEPGALTPAGTALLTLMISDYRKRVIAAVEALIPEHDHLDGHEYCINECIKRIQNVELTKE